MFSAVVPAAGSATRFGGGKVLALAGGISLLQRVLSTLLDAGVDDVVVVTPPGVKWGSRVPLLDDPRVRTAVNPDPSREMFSSIQIGLRSVAGAPIAVLPADMPFVKMETVKTLLELGRGTNALVSPRLDGRRGHPLIIPGDLRDVILAAPDSAKLNEVLKPYSSRVMNLDVEDRGVVRDVDVVGDLTGPALSEAGGPSQGGVEG